MPCPRLLSALVSWLFLGGRWKGASPGMGSGAGHIRTSRPAKYMNQAIARRGLRGSSGMRGLRGTGCGRRWRRGSRPDEEPRAMVEGGASTVADDRGAMIKRRALKPDQVPAVARHR